MPSWERPEKSAPYPIIKFVGVGVSISAQGDAKGLCRIGTVVISILSVVTALSVLGPSTNSISFSLPKVVSFG